MFNCVVTERDLSTIYIVSISFNIDEEGEVVLGRNIFVIFTFRRTIDNFDFGLTVYVGNGS